LWDYPLLILVIFGGLFFLLYSRFVPFRYFGHAINVLRGKYNDPNDPGELSHFKTLSGALAATVGMGNIGGVALAIAKGGPGALFWMWVSAFVGIATKYFTASLAVMYRGKDSLGQLQGGPMYVIREALGKNWKPLAILFCISGLFGCLPIYQANQLTQAIRDIILIPQGLTTAQNPFNANLTIGILLVIPVSLVILGGIQRIGAVAASLVPAMVVLYFIAVSFIVIINIDVVPYYLKLIVTEAFTAKAVLGGAVGQLIIIGVQRAAFSNEAGVGTAPMMHGSAKTKEPIREGLVAMLGPAIDTLLVCTLTALAILMTGVWQDGSVAGVSMTAKAFAKALPFGSGDYILMLCMLIFAVTSLFSYSYYGAKCFGFLFGAKYARFYDYFYIVTILLGATVSLSTVVSIIDISFALMTIPTMVSALVLAPRVWAASKDYFSRMAKLKKAS